MNNKLKGKTALVTGSSRGIGQQIALGLANLGANVIIHGREIKNLENTQELLEGIGVNVFKVAGDLATEDGIKNVISQVMENTDGVDILYNNAAIGCEPMSILERDIESWYELFTTNFISIVKLCNAFIPKMVQNNYGRIINLSSGIKDKPEYGPYGLSKAMVDKYTKDLAYELRDTNVLVNYLDPGWLKTDMGGSDAWFDVETVLPGALVPVLIEDNGASGRLFEAQEYKYLKI